MSEIASVEDLRGAKKSASTKLPNTDTSCWTDEPERLQAAARGFKFGKPAAFLFY
jgi:hypothetical protein